MNALIEARSCERFRLLWKELADQELSQFYYELMVSEAGHYKNFIQLAKEYCPSEEVENRWRELLSQEAVVVKSMTLRSDRIH
jgi:tRNA-(ms[2]io[6]A)-hydroxylase